MFSFDSALLWNSTRMYYWVGVVVLDLEERLDNEWAGPAQRVCSHRAWLDKLLKGDLECMKSICSCSLVTLTMVSLEMAYSKYYFTIPFTILYGENNGLFLRRSTPCLFGNRVGFLSTGSCDFTFLVKQCRSVNIFWTKQKLEQYRYGMCTHPGLYVWACIRGGAGYTDISLETSPNCCLRVMRLYLQYVLVKPRLVF